MRLKYSTQPHDHPSTHFQDTYKTQTICTSTGAGSSRPHECIFRIQEGFVELDICISSLTLSTYIYMLPDLLANRCIRMPYRSVVQLYLLLSTVHCITYLPALIPLSSLPTRPQNAKILTRLVYMHHNTYIGGAWLGWVCWCRGVQILFQYIYIYIYIETTKPKNLAVG